MTKNAEGPKCGLQYEGETGEIRYDAFHGTTLANALNILKMGFTPHLGIAGVGSYFDLVDDASAKEFALMRSGGDREQAVVIRAELHLGVVLDISFERNPEVKLQFQQFQMELKRRLGESYELTFNETKEQFLRERYPEVNSVFYFNARTGIEYVAVRDPKCIRLLSAEILTGRDLLCTH